jgi:hypothetical protein
MENEFKLTEDTKKELAKKAENNKFSWLRVLKISGAVILCGGLILGSFWLINSKAYKKASASLLKNNRLHLVDCQDLPFYTQALNTYQQHTEEVEQLKKMGAVDFVVNKVDCPSFDGSMTFSKGEINFSYTNRGNRKTIEKTLGKDFFGIPYNGYNR